MSPNGRDEDEGQDGKVKKQGKGAIPQKEGVVVTASLRRARHQTGY